MLHLSLSSLCFCLKSSEFVHFSRFQCCFNLILPVVFSNLSSFGHISFLHCNLFLQVSLCPTTRLLVSLLLANILIPILHHCHFFFTSPCSRFCCIRHVFLCVLIFLSGDVCMNPGPASARFNMCTLNIRSMTNPIHSL